MKGNDDILRRSNLAHYNLVADNNHLKHFIISLMTMIKIIEIILGIWSSSHLASNNLFDGQHHLSTPVCCHPRWEVKIANTGFLLNFQQKFRTFYLNLLTLCLVHFCNFTQVFSDDCWKKMHFWFNFILKLRSTATSRVWLQVFLHSPLWLFRQDFTP